jgi:hypothetical protein
MDMPALVAEMGREYPAQGLWPNRDEWPGRRTWTGPRDRQDAAGWLASQDRGWSNGDWLTFAVLEAEPAGAYGLAGHVGLKNRDLDGLVGQDKTAEISYWTAVRCRGRANAASCRVADKAGYPLRELSPARPPFWPTDAHIHMRCCAAA